MRHQITRRRRERERAVVAVQVLVLIMVVAGFAALSVDVGAMYSARADLQRTVDAAALAAAGALSDYGGGSPEDVARARAEEYALKNKVLGKSIGLALSDVELGRANYDAATGTFNFVPTTFLPDAVRVRARLTSDSPNGSLGLYFARALGRNAAELSAEAIAIMVPRDIAVVADLSGSHTDDSELRNYQVTDINLFDVWDDLPIPKGNNGVGNGIDPPPPGNPGNQNDAPGTGPGQPGSQGGNGDPGANPLGGQVGPTWGWLYYWGDNLSQNYDPAADPGLMFFERYADWSNADLTTWYQNVGYSSAEVDALLSADFDGSKDSNGQYGFTNRVAVALGLARWDSGIPGGLWETLPPGQTQNGNGNVWPGASELTWLVDYPFDSGSWSDYIYNYTSSKYTTMYQANPDFQYRFGLKTFVNYVLERKARNSQTPELADTPTQPMQAVKDSVDVMMDLLTTMDTNDQVSLEIYGTTAVHEVDLTVDFQQVSDRLIAMQAAHYNSYTNTGGGITRAIEELSSSRARGTSKKIIVLLTDGIANVDASGNYSLSGGASHSLAQAQAAADAGFKIFAVSVGAGADTAMMEQIAIIGGGEHFHAEGSIDEYSAQLTTIFQTIGGARTVQLVQ